MSTGSSVDGAKTDWRELAAAVKWRIEPFIDGEYRASAASEVYEDVDPATETALCDASIGDRADVDRAVAAARASCREGEWSKYSPSRRAEVLFALADLMVERKAELALLDSLEVGKPIQAALWDVDTFAPTLLRSWATAAERLVGESLPVAPGKVAFNTWEPRGVVAAITPWNFPAVNAIFKLGPALAAGNSVVLKPSELSPSSALKLAELGREAGLPAGALNVVPGLGSTVGAALAAHADVDFLTFTGSTATGRRIMTLAGESNGKPVILECGGKSPQVMADDVGDLSLVADAALQDAFFNQGQVCSAHTRLIVHKAIKDEILEKVVASAKTYVPAPPLEDSTTFGPLASPVQRDRVRSYVQRGLEAGAEAALLGEAQMSGGCFVSPTVFTGVTPSMSIVQEEIFGPVLCIQEFESDEEAIALANGTDYALSATVWTRDLGRATRMASALESAVVVVRTAGEESPYADLRSELVLGNEPRKASGFGAEFGVDGLKSYSTLKAIYINGA
jgi:acyl-CoA reductase-like NAD-dependent aldehyde dehydrogenase